VIKAIIFDLDNTLVDFMAMKEAAIEAAVLAMIDAGLKTEKETAKKKIYEIYEEGGIEDQKVFDKFLTKELGKIDYRIHAAGIIGYRRAREAALVLYPHVQLAFMELIKRGLKLAVVSDAGAKLLGMKTIFARYGDRFGTINSGADYEIDDIVQILDILDKLSEK